MRGAAQLVPLPGFLVPPASIVSEKDMRSEAGTFHSVLLGRARRSQSYILRAAVALVLTVKEQCATPTQLLGALRPPLS